MSRQPRTPSSERTHQGIVFLSLVLAGLVVGCGNVTAGGLSGEAVVAVSGDAPDVEGLASPAPGLASAVEGSTNGEPEGEVEVKFLLFLEGADGRSIALSDQEIRVRVDLRGRQEADVVNREIPAMRYTDLRVVFTEIKAEVDSGLIINGEVILGDIRVELEDTTLTVVRPLSLDVSEGERVDLLLDLNAAVWLQAVNPDLKQVAEDFFADALSLVVR